MTVTLEDARRIAVRAQLLDGSALGVLETVRRLGFLQIDTVRATEAPQYLVLWSRLGDYDPAELDRLLWEERKLFEWNAFIYPIESLPLIRARMHHYRRATKYSWQRWSRDFLRRNESFRRYVLRALERRGPLRSRELEDRSVDARTPRRWYGSRDVGIMLDILHRRGYVAIVGRRGNERLWDLAQRWYPDTDPVPLAEAERVLEEQRFRALGVRLGRDGAWEVHPDADARPVHQRTTLLSPFDRLVYDRDRAEALWGFRYRLEMYVPPAKREYGYYVLPMLHGDRVVGRIDPLFDRKASVLRVNAVHWEPGAPRDVPLRATVDALARWLGAREVEMR